MSHLRDEAARYGPELEHRLLARFRRDELYKAQLRVAVAVMLDTKRTVSDFPGLRRMNGRSPEGDRARLRAIPVIGARGVPSAIPGTDPVRALLAKEARAERRNGRH